MTVIQVTIEFDAEDLPSQLQGWPLSRWTTADVALLLEDGDGGAVSVLTIEETDDQVDAVAKALPKRPVRHFRVIVSDFIENRAPGVHRSECNCGAVWPCAEATE